MPGKPTSIRVAVTKVSGRTRGIVGFKIGDEEFNIQESIIAFKIDVEGHEINVLNGIKQLLNNNKCIIQIEIFDKHFEQINKFLTENKFYKITKAKHITVFSELFTVRDYFYTNIK